MRHTIFPLLFFLTLFLAGCHSSEVSEAEPLRHATLLRMELADSFTRVEVRDAWHEGRTLQTYVLVPRSQRVPSNLPEGILVRTPLKRVVVFSSVHAALLHDLSCEKQLVAMTDTTYAVDPRLKEGLRQGRIADAGSSMAPNVERLLALKPDAVFVPPMEGANYGLLEKAGLTLVQCADYLETSALGRAEWMRFFGRLLGAETQADSLFSDISERHRCFATRSKERPGTRRAGRAIWGNFMPMPGRTICLPTAQKAVLRHFPWRRCWRMDMKRTCGSLNMERQTICRTRNWQRTMRPTKVCVRGRNATSGDATRSASRFMRKRRSTPTACCKTS